MGKTFIIPISRGNHFSRKYTEGRKVTKLWYPRPSARECAERTPQIAERIRKLLEYGYSVAEISGWFSLKGCRAATNTAEAKPIWEDIKAIYGYRCAYCGKHIKDLTKDHVIPVSQGGRDWMDNIVPACKACNSSKQAKDLLDWDKFYNLQLHLLGF